MTEKMMENSQMPDVLLCRCDSAHRIPEEKLAAALEVLQRSGGDTVVVPDLCGLAVKDPDRLREWVNDRELFILACRPRSVKWLLHRAGIAPSAGACRVVDLREAVVAELPLRRPEGTVPAVQSAGELGAWPPWFPVIDYERCGNCKQCLNFCLFGVYELDESGRVRVAHPANCKNECPACARICPDVAILFPKLPPDEAPLDGAEVADEAAQTARVKVDLETLLGDDVYAALEQRKRERRRRLLRRQIIDRAHQEREACSRPENVDRPAGREV